LISVCLKAAMVEVDPNVYVAVRHLHEARILSRRMSARAEERIGEIIDRYRIEALLGEGGFGAVYRAKHTVMERDVALKLLHPGSDQDNDTRDRFLREAQAAAAVGHHAIVQIFDCGVTKDGHAFIAMEMLHGEDLEEHLKKHGSLTRERAIRLVVNLLDALEAAHRAGIVHRDLKPANIFLLEDSDSIKILDFGISQMRGEGIRSLTRTGMVMGTPHYMAPETFRGVANVDLRADLYAVGAILYELFAGTTPHEANSYEQLVVRVATMPAPLIREAVPDLVPELARVVDYALASNPDERWPDARSFREALLPFTGPGLGTTQEDASATMGAPISMTPAWGIGAAPTPKLPERTEPVAATDPLGATGLADASRTPTEYVATPSAHPPASPDGQSPSRSAPLFVVGAVCTLLIVLGFVFLAAQNSDDDVSVQTTPASPSSFPVQAPTPTSAPTPPANVEPETLPDKPDPPVEVQFQVEAEPVAPSDSQQGSVQAPLAPPAPLPPPASDEVRVELVSALSTSRGPAIVFGDSVGPHVLRCARNEAHTVRVMLMVNDGGQISIAQPDPNEEHGDNAVAACVANRMGGRGPIPNGDHGILVYTVELPAR
jgi:serine/threonine protein kinase